MKKRAVIACAGGALLVLAGLAWATAVPVTESLSRPPVPALASIEARGAAAFAGAGFGGIGTDALASNAVPWRIVAAALVLEEQKRDPAAKALPAVGVDRFVLRRAVIGGALSFVAYGLVLWAMTFAPIAGVSAFRETSVVFAARIGIIFFGERAGPRRLIGAAIVAAGAVVLKLA